MGIETLIKRLNQYSQSLIAYKLGADFADTCMDAAAVLSTLQTENKKLRAELEKVMRERDAAQSLLAERIGVRGAEPITTAFGLPIDRLRELAQADREGRCVVLPCKVGDTVYQVDDIRVYALEVRNLIYDAGILAFDESTIGKTVFLTRAEAEAALQGEQEEKR